MSTVAEINLHSTQIDIMVKKYENIFEGIGELKELYHIQLRKEIQPIVEPPTKIPLSIQKQVKKIG